MWRQLPGILLPVLLVGFCARAMAAQEAAKPALPPVPSKMEAAEYHFLRESARQVANGAFDQAAPRLKANAPAATPRIFADWSSVPRTERAAYRSALEQTAQHWTLALGTDVAFQWSPREEDADVLLFFDARVATLRFSQAHLLCSSSALKLAEPGGKRLAVIRISLAVPDGDDAHSAASAAHLFGQGLGVYLGLSATQSEEDLMGPDTHNSRVAVRPSATDVRRAKELLEIRRLLAHYAEKRVAAHAARPVATFAKTEMDAGEVWRGDNARLVFSLKNSGDAPLELEAEPNCGCVVPEFDRVIAPGKEGKITAELKTAALRGQIVKTIDVRSNDPDRPQMRLYLRATVLSVVQVLPTDTPIVALKEAQPTVKELELRVRGKEPVKIDRIQVNVPYATAETEQGAGPVFKLKVRVAPEAPVGRSAFLVTIQTNSSREPQVTVTVICEKGILAVPSNVFLGAITPRTPTPVEQIVTLMKREGKFHIQKVTSDDPRLTVRVEPQQDGMQYRLIFSYMGGWSPGAVRARVVAYTDDPKQPQFEIPVMANVVAASR